MKFQAAINYTVLTLLAGMCGGLSYKLYQNQQDIRALLEAQEVTTSNTITPVVERLVSAHPTWSNIENLVRDAVPQVFANKAAIDVLQPQKSPSLFQASGSGFFINPDGEFVTNAHVVDQAKSIWVQIPSMGKQQFEAELIGISHDRDLALVKIKPDGLAKIREHIKEIPFLELGNSDLVHAPDHIMAIGYPLGQRGIKFTAGVVSGREAHMIQIDAAINPGSSGGPSVSLNGEVIGINTAGITEAQNIGYIIPVNELKIILDDLRKVQLLRKPSLGVFFNDASKAATELFGNPHPGGLLVVDVFKDSPLYKAGVKKHDMIYEINGHKIDIYGEMLWNGEKVSLLDYLAQLKLGQDIHLVVYRNGERKEVAIKFEQSQQLPIHKIHPGYEKLDYEIVGGMIVQPLTINHLAQLVNVSPGLTRFAEMKHQLEPALIITHIFIDSEAQKSRTVMPGCVLSKINGKEVKTLDEFRTALFASFDTDKLTIETAESFFVVLPFRKLLEDERSLASAYFYTITPGMQALLDKYDAEKKDVKETK